MSKRVCFIGGGNMAEAMIAGMVGEYCDAKNIIVVDRNKNKRDFLVRKYGVNVVDSAADTVKSTDILVLAIKPQQMKELILDIKDNIKSKQLIITVAAGLEIEFYEKLFSKKISVARVMPNIPSSLGYGAAGVFFNKDVNDNQKKTVVDVIRTMGVVEVVKQENDINLVTACSGSGPAYYLLFMEHMINSAVSRGFTKKQAESLVVQTCLGAAQMAMNSSSDISTLRENVTSKKGVTAEALRVFEESDLGGIIDKAIEANIIRSEELANEMSSNLD